MEKYKCQLYQLKNMSLKIGIVEVMAHIGNRGGRIFKRRINYLRKWITEIANKSGKCKLKEENLHAEKKSQQALKSGDLVQVKSRHQIEESLDRWNHYKGCGFMEEMWSYCGTTQKVLKRVERFLDERDYLIKKCNGIVLLENILCEGTKDFGPCDRTCFYFWREEWLQKIN